MFDWIKKYYIILLIGTVGICVILFIDFNDDENLTKTEMFDSPSTNNNSSLIDEVPDSAMEEKILVDIKGSVKNPGVYEMNVDDRVNDVIDLAGGFLANAEESVINLAQKVFDEMVIIVPEKGEGAEGITQTSGTGKLRINHATAEEIQSLNGIGPAKAQAIIQYREENGSFQSVEELLEVPGIGEKTLQNFESDIQIP